MIEFALWIIVENASWGVEYVITGKCKHTDWKPSGGLVGMWALLLPGLPKTWDASGEKIEDTSFFFFLRIFFPTANLTQRFLISKDKEVKSWNVKDEKNHLSALLPVVKNPALGTASHTVVFYGKHGQFRSPSGTSQFLTFQAKFWFYLS